jgi:hypothetical protein
MSPEESMHIHIIAERMLSLISQLSHKVIQLPLIIDVSFH